MAKKRKKKTNILVTVHKKHKDKATQTTAETWLSHFVGKVSRFCYENGNRHVVPVSSNQVIFLLCQVKLQQYPVRASRHR